MNAHDGRRHVIVGIDLPRSAMVALAGSHGLPLLNAVTSSRDSSIWAPGLAEVASRRAATSFAIEFVTPGQDEVSVVYRGAFATQSYYGRNRILLLDRALDATLRHVDRPTYAAAVSSTGISRSDAENPPSFGDLVGYLTRQLYRLAARRLRRSRTTDPFAVWLRQDGAEFARPGTARRLANPDAGYFADPFILADDSPDGPVRLVVEQFSDTDGRAHISEVTVHDDGSTSVATVINEPFHLSFPFPVHDGDRLYLCPEASASHRVTLYREADGSWAPVAVLLDGVDAVDPCVIKHGEHWYLIVTADSTGNGELLSQLHVFVADTLETANWSPHPLNPVVESPFGGRSGGLIQDESGLLRVGQFHDFGEYGSGINLYDIVELSPTAYREEIVAADHPLRRRLPAGAHHFSVGRRHVAFDRAG